MPGDEHTISFAVWPHLITLEGPAATLAALIDELYQDARLPRDTWGLGSSSAGGRRATVEKLRAQGKVLRRVGLAALTLATSDEIERRARAAGVKCFAMHVPGREK